jgi:hypothetical protein
VRSRAIAVLATAAVAAVLGSNHATSASGYAPGVELFAFQDTRIQESSGIVASSVRDGVFFTHNDSGDLARFFAVDDRGCTLASYEVDGIDDEAFKATHDVEDIARGPYDGSSSVWLADIGDNYHQRPQIAVMRIDEPNSNASAVRASDGCPSPDTVAVTATTYVLQYPDTAHDAETLLADPETGQLFIVTKAPILESMVYAAPVPLDPNGVNTLELVGAIAFPPSTTYDRDPATEVARLATGSEQIAFDTIGRLWAVGGDIAPARDRVVVRTQTDAFEWIVPEGASIGEVLTTTRPLQVPLVYDRQGEAIGYTRDGTSLVTTSEFEHAVAHLYAGTP